MPLSKVIFKNKAWLLIIIFCLIANLTITSVLFASDDRTAPASPNDGAFAGAILVGLLGGGAGAAIGSPLGYFGMGALIGAEAGAFEGALIGAGQKSNQQENKPSQWTVSEEALIFDRVGTAKWVLVERVPADTKFLSVPTTPSTPALNSTDLNQGYAPGMRLGLDYHVDSSHDLLLSFFYIGTWDSIKSVGPDNPLNWLEMKAPGAFFQTQDFAYQSMTWDYSTQLYNAELNAQKKVSDRITLLVGFRWLQLRENLQGTIPPADTFQPDWKPLNWTLNQVAGFTNGTPAPAYPPFWNTSTANNLYGFQVGAEGKIFERGRFSINGLIKGGSYLNHASELTGVSLAKTVYESGASANRAAFVGEGGLQCKYQVTRAITLKLGYEVLWLAGVALAPGQIRETYIITAPTGVYTHDVNSASNVLFHGVTAGLEFKF
jgi:hypothetical protein